MVSKAKRLIPLAKGMRHAPTPMENKLWQVLRNRQLDGLKFRRQVPFGPYIVDFYCADASLVIELDGGGHIDKEEYDEQRTTWITSQGFKVLRFTNDDINSNINAVVELIREAVEKT